MAHIHEECGVFGIYAKTPLDLARLTYYGLFALQHRGQESAGIVINDDGVFSVYRDIGLVGEVFTPEVLGHLGTGNISVGHVRYATTGVDQKTNAQPLVINHHKGRMALAHNGNLVNSFELRRQLEEQGSIFHTTTDTEVIAYIIVQKRLTCGSIEAAVDAAMDVIEGAYSLVISSPAKLIAARDPRGFHPLCMGELPDGSVVFASESCALDAVGAAFLREVRPGEIVTVDENGIHSNTRHCTQVEQALCAFEYIYFSRPDSIVGGVGVSQARQKAGAFLATEHPLEADVVIGVPDSGIDAAIGYSQASGIPYAAGFTKNKYIGRTFIAPDQSMRDSGVQLKLNPIRTAINGKRVILIDDSIVRGTTSRHIIDMVRRAGAAEVHMLVSAPPFIQPCYYGIDIDSVDHLIANHHTVEEIAQIIGADSLGFLSLESVGHIAEAAGKLCTACFGGGYPTNVPSCTEKDRFAKRIHDNG